MKTALLECQQTCQTKQEKALSEEREKSRAAIETALQEERTITDKLIAELKVRGLQCTLFVTLSCNGN